MMHKGVEHSKEAEQEANQFAGALRIPPSAFENVGLKPFAWTSVKVISDRCNVNLLPSLRRAFDLELISRPVYTAAMADSTRRGWRARDPFDVQVPETLPSAGYLSSTQSSRRG